MLARRACLRAVMLYSNRARDACTNSRTSPPWQRVASRLHAPSRYATFCACLPSVAARRSPMACTAPEQSDESMQASHLCSPPMLAISSFPNPPHALRFLPPRVAAFVPVLARDQDDRLAQRAARVVGAPELHLLPACGRVHVREQQGQAPHQPQVATRVPRSVLVDQEA